MLFLKGRVVCGLLLNKKKCLHLYKENLSASFFFLFFGCFLNKNMFACLRNTCKVFGMLLNTVVWTIKKMLACLMLNVNRFNHIVLFAWDFSLKYLGFLIIILLKFTLDSFEFTVLSDLVYFFSKKHGLSILYLLHQYSFLWDIKYHF